MSPQLPHQRVESGPSNSGSSSAESLRQRAPNTPPQVHLGLDPVAVSDATGFSDFFPWIKENEAQLGDTQGTDNLAVIDPSTPVHKESTSANCNDVDTLAAFQQRDAAHLPKQSLQLPTVSEAEPQASSPGLLQNSHQMQMTSTSLSPRPVENMPLPQSISRPDLTVNRVSTSSADFYTVAEHHPRRSWAEREGVMPLAEESRRLSGASFDQDQLNLGPSQIRHSLASPGAFASPAPSLPRSSRSPKATQLIQQDNFIQPEAPSRNTFIRTSVADMQADNEVLDIFEDDKLPGYQVWRRGSSSSNAMVVRVPRQIVGWKAVLMDAGGFGDAAFNLAETSKKARRASKVTGKQGWEVRQEALKNSYDFRRGSGIWATMHAGHHLFKHDWHVIVKDGSRYMWRMDKHALALYREEDDVKVAEFRKTVPSSSPTSQLVYGGEGYAPDMEKRIGSFNFEGSLPTGPDAIFDINLALASLIAVFKARGGHQNVSAAFEPSSDPLRKVLEQQRQDTPDREEVMLALPRPGFARDAESILSDTTDEDAASIRQSTRRAPPSSRRTDTRPPSTQMHSNNASSVTPAPRTTGGRKRFSSLFGRGEAPTDRKQAEEPTRANDRSMTDAQRIARQYRTQSMFLKR